jgi:hypothetical protein
VIDSSFWNRLRVKALLDRYMDGFIEYAKALQDEYSLTDIHILGVIKMVDANKVARLSALWETVVPIVPSFSNIPDGDYVGDIKEMLLGEAKNSGRLQVVTTLEVVEGEFIGKTVKRFDGLDDEQGQGMGYFKHLCEVIGLDLPADLNVWQEHLDAFVGDQTRIDLYNFTAKTTKGKEGQEYSNIYVNGISEYTKGEGEQQVEEQAGVVEEVVEEVVETQAAVEQEIVVPTRRAAPRAKAAVPAPAAVAAPVRTAPVRQLAAPAPVATPVRRVAAPVRTLAPVAAPAAAPVRRTAPLRRTA